MHVLSTKFMFKNCLVYFSWRLYAVDEGTICVATWKNYEVKTYQESKSPNDGNSSSILDSQKRALWKKFSFQKQEDEKTTAQMISNTLIDFNQTQAQTSSNDSVLHINNQPSLKYDILKFVILWRTAIFAYF